jgi:hypothetical protein
MAEKYRNAANPLRAHADAERARSNAWGSHDNRPKRERSRDAVRRAEIRRSAD